jgi:hypothetical protein
MSVLGESCGITVEKVYIRVEVTKVQGIISVWNCLSMKQVTTGLNIPLCSTFASITLPSQICHHFRKVLELQPEFFVFSLPLSPSGLRSSILPISGELNNLLA